MPNSSGLSWWLGWVTTSRWVPSQRTESADNDAERSRKTSKSVRASHGGLIGALEGCREGCMSVDGKSRFSYHVADGSTMAEAKGGEVLRKSVVSIKSSFPCGAFSCHLMVSGRSPSANSCAVASESTPSK